MTYKLITPHNLRPDYDRPGTLIRADLPATAIDGGDWTPRATAPLPDGSAALIVTSGRKIGVATRGSVPHRITLPDTPRAVALLPDSRVVVMSDSGRHIFTPGPDRLTPASDPADPPAGITLSTVALADIATYRSEIKLSKSYDGLRRLNPADADRLITEALAAYIRLDSAARAAGCLFRPAVGQLRFCRADGSVAFTSAPALLTHPTRVAGGATVRFRSADREWVTAGSVEAPAWRVRVDLPAASLPEITSAQLVVSPLLHATDTGSRRDDALVSDLGTGAADTFCTVTLPPAPADTYGNPGVAGAAASLAAAIDTCGTVVATIPRPFDPDTATTHTLSVSLPGDVAADNAALLDILRRARAATPAGSADSAALLAPNSFIATRFATSGGTILWGALSALPFAGHPPCAFAATRGTSPWRGYSRVRFADGSQVVRLASGTSGAPLELMPMLIYPSPQAISIEIGIDNGDGHCYRATVPLTPDTSRRIAWYADPYLRPWPIPAADSYAEPSPSAAAPVALPGMIAAAPADAPFDISCLTPCGASLLRDIRPARHSTSAWDFGRARFFLFTSEGIRSATVSADRAAISLGIIDPRPCPADASAPAVDTPDGVAAIAGSDIVLIAGTRVTTLRHAAPCRALIFDYTRHELWCLPPAGAAGGITVLCPRLAWQPYTIGIDSPDPARTLSSPRGSYLGTAAALLHLDRPDPVPWLPIRYDTEITPAPPRRASPLRPHLRYLTVDLHGTVSRMHLSITRCHHGRDAPAPDITLTLDGPVTSPQRLPWVAPAAVNLPAARSSPTLHLTITGQAAPSLTLTPPI